MTGAGKLLDHICKRIGLPHQACYHEEGTPKSIINSASDEITCPNTPPSISNIRRTVKGERKTGRKNISYSHGWTCLCYPGHHYAIKTFHASYPLPQQEDLTDKIFIAHLIWSSFYFYFGISCDSILRSSIYSLKYLNATKRPLARQNVDGSITTFPVCYL